MSDLATTLAAASRAGDVLKAHGTGNDFVVIVDMDDQVALTASMVAALCDRHRGVGGDGVIRITPTVPGDVDDATARAVAAAPVFMDYRNADGSIVQMCGNGVRVVAKVVHDRGIVKWADGGDLLVGTRAGLRPVHVMGDAVGDRAPVVTHVSVDMGAPVQTARAVGLVASAIDGDVTDFRLKDPGPVPATMGFAGMSVGNPHAVTVVRDVAAVPLASLGPVVEHHPAFADGVNVNVVQVDDAHHLHLRVWERGVGETQACGTGACATVAALAAAGRVDLSQPVEVTVSGGRLTIERRADDHLVMTGPARVVARVDLDPEWIAQVQ